MGFEVKNGMSFFCVSSYYYVLLLYTMIQATVIITCRYDGVIQKIHYEEGDFAKVGSPLVDIYDENAEEEGNCYMHVAVCAKPYAPINTFCRRKKFTRVCINCSNKTQDICRKSIYQA